MAYLVFTKKGPDKPYKLGNTQIVIGRSPDCSIVIKSNQLSRKHCRIYPGPRGYVIEDLGSSNGTKINGIKITEGVTINEDDKIKLGDAEFYFTLIVETKKAKLQTQARKDY